jgi:hypothetical protein
VLQFGFDHASRHRVSLRAVLCWHPDLLAAMMWRPEPPAPERVEAWLPETLAGGREKYRDVELHAEVIREHPADALVLASLSQYLLVVGSRGPHALPGTLLGSVSHGARGHPELVQIFGTSPSRTPGSWPMSRSAEDAMT